MSLREYPFVSAQVNQPVSVRYRPFRVGAAIDGVSSWLVIVGCFHQAGTGFVRVYDESGAIIDEHIFLEASSFTAAAPTNVAGTFSPYPVVSSYTMPRRMLVPAGGRIDLSNAVVFCLACASIDDAVAAL